jgi:hypothetical protein
VRFARGSSQVGTYCKIRLGDRNAGCTCTLTGTGPHPECLRAVEIRELSGQGERVCSSRHRGEIAARRAPVPETRGNVLGTCARPGTGTHPAFEGASRSGPHMTIYPVDFHRRSEQKWARRASRASEALRHLRYAHGDDEVPIDQPVLGDVRGHDGSIGCATSTVEGDDRSLATERKGGAGAVATHRAALISNGNAQAPPRTRRPSRPLSGLQRRSPHRECA